LNPDVLKALLATAAAVIPAVITLVGGLSRADRRPRGHKRLLDLVDLWARLPEKSSARSKVGELIDNQAASLAERESNLQPINPANVALTTILSLLLGLGCYFLVAWAIGAGSWSWLAWIVATIAILLTLTFVAAAIGTWRNPVTNKQAQSES